MKIEEAFSRFVGQECLVYTVMSAGTSMTSSVLECVVEETGDGWVRISQKNGKDEPTESIVNIANIVRIREYPKNKNGKKKAVFV